MNHIMNKSLVYFSCFCFKDPNLYFDSRFFYELYSTTCNKRIRILHCNYHSANARFLY